MPASHIHGAQPVLHVSGNLSLQPDEEHSEDVDESQNDDTARKHGQEDLEKLGQLLKIQYLLQQPPDGVHLSLPVQRSISPSTISILPTIATISEIMAPRLISVKALMAVKHGDLTFTL